MKDQFDKEMFDKLRGLPDHRKVASYLSEFRSMISHEIPETTSKELFQKLIKVLLHGKKVNLEGIRKKYLYPELKKESKLLEERKREFDELRKSAQLWVKSNLSEEELQKQWKNHKSWLPRRYTIYKNPNLPFQEIAIDTLSRYYLITLGTNLIKILYDEDTEDRSYIDWDNKKEVRELNKRDERRKEKIREIIKKEGLISGLDYHHASLIFQHGETSKDYKLAHELAKKAVDLGDETAKWLYAATFDRWLLSEGKAQKYGTQFKQDKNGEWGLAQPIDPSITDEERLKYRVPPLSEALSIYKAKYNLK